MTYIKTPEQIAILKKAGKISKEILDASLKLCIEGNTTLSINNLIESEMLKHKATPWFKEINDYPYASCISVNDVWIHGFPNETILKAGDIISIDLGVKYKDMYVDHCKTVAVGKVDDKVSEFLKTGEASLAAAIAEFKEGNRVGDISYAIQTTIEQKNYSVIENFSGHGVGIRPHEEPQIMCYGTPGVGKRLKKGMVLAIEVMYTMGTPENKVLKDGWTVTTGDGSLSAMFEHTVALTENGPEILTI